MLATYRENAGTPYSARYSVNDLVAVLSSVALILLNEANAAGFSSDFRYIIETQTPIVEFVGDASMIKLA